MKHQGNSIIFNSTNFPSRLDDEICIQENLVKRKMKKKFISIISEHEDSFKEFNLNMDGTISEKIKNKVIKNYILEAIQSKYNKSCKSYRYNF